MSFTASYLRLIKPGETALIFIYATRANRAVSPYGISGVSIKKIRKRFLLI